MRTRLGRKSGRRVRPWRRSPWPAARSPRSHAKQSQTAMKHAKTAREDRGDRGGSHRGEKQGRRWLGEGGSRRFRSRRTAGLLRATVAPPKRERGRNWSGERERHAGGLGFALKKPGARRDAPTTREGRARRRLPRRTRGRLPSRAGVKTAPTSGPGRSAAGRGAWAVAWCGRRRGCWAESGGWAERGRGEEGERAAREKDHVGRK